MAAANPAHASVDPNQYPSGAGPTRDEYEEANPVQKPTRKDLDKAIHPDVQKKNKAARDKAESERQKDSKWLEDEQERRYQKDLKAREKQREKEERERKKPRAGLELPKYGLGRLSGAGDRLSGKPLFGRGLSFGQNQTGIVMNPGAAGMHPSQIRRKGAFGSIARGMGDSGLRMDLAAPRRNPGKINGNVSTNLNAFPADSGLRMGLQKKRGKSSKRSMYDLGLFR